MFVDKHESKSINTNVMGNYDFDKLVSNGVGRDICNDFLAELVSITFFRRIGFLNHG